MELRVLQYFLVVTREQSISGAAESLHLSQPTLSRQLKELEAELGKQLFIRGTRRISLTEEGMILRKRAEEVMDLIHKAEQKISVTDSFGILMRKDSPLAPRDFLTPEDLHDKPLIFNRSTRNGDLIMSWLKKSRSEIHVAATYNLLFNASLMVEEGLGYAFALDKIINITEDSGLLFKPLSPAIHANMNLIWKKYRCFSKPSQKFLEKITLMASL